MSSIHEAMDILKKRYDGILYIFEMDDNLSRTILDVEHAVTSPTGVEVRNDAYDEVMKFDHRICVVYDDTKYIHMRKSAVIEMRSFDEEVVGTEIPPDQIELYKDRDDVIWISDNFVMFTDKTLGPVRFVMPPMKLYELENDGFADAIWSSPSPPSSTILKSTCGLGERPKTSTMVIGLNLR